MGQLLTKGSCGNRGRGENISFQLCQLTSAPFCPFDYEEEYDEDEEDDVGDLLPLAVVLLQDVVDLDATMLVGILTSKRNPTLLVVQLKTRFMLHGHSWKKKFKIFYGLKSTWGDMIRDSP